MHTPLSHGYLKTPDGHELYYAQFGNARAPAAVVLHGGPGSRCHLSMLDWFDLAHWRVVLFDQRGCGKSRPTGSLEHNTTGHLVTDIEQLRLYLGIVDWVVIGGSWGAFLALAYAADHAHAVRHLVLRGTFLPSQLQLKWFFDDLRALIPQAWETLTQTMSADQKNAVLNTLSDRLFGDDGVLQADAAQRWGTYEDSIMSVMMQRNATHAQSGSPTEKKTPSDAGYAESRSTLASVNHAASSDGDRARTGDFNTRETPAQASERRIRKYRIQAHYLQHRAFVDLPSLLARLQHQPVAATLVHGTHDWICPPANVRLLQRFLHSPDIRWVPGGTHTTSDPLIVAALTATLTRLSEVS